MTKLEIGVSQLMLTLLLFCSASEAGAYDVGSMIPPIDPRYDAAIHSATQATAITLGVSRDLDLVSNYINNKEQIVVDYTKSHFYNLLGEKNATLISGAGYILYKQDVRFKLPIKLLSAEETVHANLAQADLTLKWELP